MSLIKTPTPAYQTQPAENSSPWDWLRTVLGPTAVRYIGHKALTSEPVQARMRGWLHALSRTRTPDYHKGRRCDEIGKSPDRLIES